MSCGLAGLGSEPSDVSDKFNPDRGRGSRTKSQVTSGIELNRDGIYHICGSERVSRYQFAVRTAELFGLDPGLIQCVKSADLNQIAPRPAVTGFVTLKAQTELGIKAMDITQGLTLLKRELQGAGRN